MEVAGRMHVGKKDYIDYHYNYDYQNYDYHNYDYHNYTTVTMTTITRAGSRGGVEGVATPQVIIK